MVGEKFCVNIHAEHVPGVENVSADALSRDNVVTFMQVVPEAERYPRRLSWTLQSGSNQIGHRRTGSLGS